MREGLLFQGWPSSPYPPGCRHELSHVSKPHSQKTARLGAHRDRHRAYNGKRATATSLTLPLPLLSASSPSQQAPTTTQTLLPTNHAHPARQNPASRKQNSTRYVFSHASNLACLDKGQGRRPTQLSSLFPLNFSFLSLYIFSRLPASSHLTKSPASTLQWATQLSTATCLIPLPLQ